MVEGLPNRRRDVRRRRGLDHVRQRPCFERRIDDRRVGGLAEDDHSKSGVTVSGRPDERRPRHPAVQRVRLGDYEIGTQSVDERQRMGGRGRLSHHFDADGTENRFNRIKPQRMRVEQHRRSFCGGLHRKGRLSSRIL
jgi:hypothetical protein